MKGILISIITTITLLVASAVHAQQSEEKPGLAPYVPTRIEWLALVLNSQLRQDATLENPFSLNVVETDHETLLLLVRYHTSVNREIMNSSIDIARKVIMMSAKSYGWDKWLRVRERVEMAPPTPR